MRISTDKHDPGYDETAASRALKVVLDNRPVTGCITADSDRGEIVTYTPLTWKPWAAVTIPAFPDEKITYTYRGKVKIYDAETRRYL